MIELYLINESIKWSVKPESTYIHLRQYNKIKNFLKDYE